MPIMYNPFHEMWNNFNPEEFKAELGEIVDKMILAKNDESIADAYDELDEQIALLVIMMKFKDTQNLEMISLSDLAPEAIEELGIEPEDMMDGLVPRDIVPPEFLPKKKKKNGGGWIV